MTLIRVVLLGFVAIVAIPTAADDSLAEALWKDGWVVENVAVPFSRPIIPEGASAEVESACLKSLAGSDRALSELTRDSVTAPFILRTRDEVVADRGIARKASLWFVIRAQLDQIDLDKLAAEFEGKEIEAGNMRTKARRLGESEILGRGLPTGPGISYVHSSGRLLDRIEVSATTRVVATRRSDDCIIASRIEPLLDGDPTLPNQWNAVTRQNGKEINGPARPYAGGASLVRIARLITVPGALLVEAQFVFFEPREWFDGAPILRSKLSLIAQDRIRALRRDLAREASR